MLTLEAIVADISEEKKDAPAGGGQGGMGDMSRLEVTLSPDGPARFLRH